MVQPCSDFLCSVFKLSPGLAWCMLQWSLHGTVFALLCTACRARENMLCSGLVRTYGTEQHPLPVHVPVALQVYHTTT